MRTQLRNHPLTGGWSVSGVSLAAVMYWHQAGIDIVAVPAACYFLWVTYSLYQGWLHDWNSAPEPAIRLGAEEPSPVAS